MIVPRGERHCRANDPVTYQDESGYEQHVYQEIAGRSEARCVMLQTNSVGIHCRHISIQYWLYASGLHTAVEIHDICHSTLSHTERRK